MHQNELIMQASRTESDLVTEGHGQELQHAEAKIERAMKNAFYEVGTELRHIYERKLYLLRYSTFEEYCEQRWEMSHQRAHQLMSASTIVEELSTKVDLVDMVFPTGAGTVGPWKTMGIFP